MVRTDPGKSWNFKVEIFHLWKIMESVTAVLEN